MDAYMLALATELSHTHKAARPQRPSAPGAAPGMTMPTPPITPSEALNQMKSVGHFTTTTTAAEIKLAAGRVQLFDPTGNAMSHFTRFTTPDPTPGYDATKLAEYKAALISRIVGKYDKAAAPQVLYTEPAVIALLATATTPDLMFTAIKGIPVFTKATFVAGSGAVGAASTMNFPALITAAITQTQLDEYKVKLAAALFNAYSTKTGTQVKYVKATAEAAISGATVTALLTAAKAVPKFELKTTADVDGTPETITFTGPSGTPATIQQSDLDKYKADLAAELISKFKTAGHGQAKYDLAAAKLKITGSTLDELLAKAKAADAFAALTIGQSTTVTVKAAPTSVLPGYIASLKAAFKDLFTDAANTQAVVTTSIDGLTTPQLAKDAADAIAAHVFSAKTAGATATITLTATPSFDVYHPTPTLADPVETLDTIYQTIHI